MQFTVLEIPGPGRSKPHLRGPAAVAVDLDAIRAKPRRKRSMSNGTNGTNRTPDETPNVTSAAEKFWDALAVAKRAYNRSHDYPLPWAETPAGARRLRFRNQHGCMVSVKQPAQFTCPPARFWPGGRIPLGVAAPPAMLDWTDAEWEASNYRRWRQAPAPKREAA